MFDSMKKQGVLAIQQTIIHCSDNDFVFRNVTYCLFVHISSKMRVRFIV